MKKIVAHLFFIIIASVLISTTFQPASGALDTTKIGVQVGDKRTWEILAFTSNGIYADFLQDSDDLKKGDRITVEIVDISLESDNTIEIKGTYPNGTMENDRNDMTDIGTDSWIVFTDWAYWKIWVEGQGFISDGGSSTFKFSIELKSEFVAGDDNYDLGDISIAEHSQSYEYDKSTGFVNSWRIFFSTTHVNGSKSIVDVQVGPVSSDDSALSGFGVIEIFGTFLLMIALIIKRRRNR